jgi:processing peptidase subunit alpha
LPFPPPDKVTTLANGVRVATEPTPGHFSAVGVFVEAGSRYESSPALSGVSHIVDRLAFKSTKSRTQMEMIQALESLGGTQMCSSSREALMYTASVFNQDVETMTELLADTVRNPLVTEEEVQAQCDTAEYEISEIWQKPEMILPELLHGAAYKGTLGNPLLCPEERIPHMTRQSVLDYRAQFFVPDRIVLGFVGLPHDEAVRLADKYFGSMKPGKPFKTLAAKYTGGSTFLPSSSIPNEQWTHLHIAYEAPSLESKEIYALATLQILLGGGGSFSAGGPGKGMYSRLYLNVLNQYGWIDSCQAFNHTYRDSGLFGISASSRPDTSYAMAGVIAKEFASLYDTGSRGIGKVEAQRAKNQLRSSLLMNLESKMICLEDLGRQVQSLGVRLSAEEMCHHIEVLTVGDLQALAYKMLSVEMGSRPTVVAAGQGVERIGDIYGQLRRHGLQHAH